MRLYLFALIGIVAAARAQAQDPQAPDTTQPPDTLMPPEAQPSVARGSAADSARVDHAIRRAHRFVADGRAAAGRAVIDSVLATTPTGTLPYAEALYARGSLATSAATAERDYRQITVEYPTSPRAVDALLRLAQLELARGDRQSGAAHLDRLTREYAGRGPIAARTEYEIAQGYLELNDLGAACPVLDAARGDAAPTDVELVTRIKYALQRCMHVESPLKATKPTPVPPMRPPKQVASADSSPPPQAAPPPPPRGAAHREFTIQVAAYNIKAQADALVSKLTTDGYTARVWGTHAPFRVRIGRYTTWAEANTARKDLTAKQIESFVTDAEP